MGHALLHRLIDDLGWPLLVTEAEALEFVRRPGVHVLFVPGDWSRNLETADVAVILPELQAAFRNQFDCAVVGEEIEPEIKESSGVFKTPSLILYRDGQCLAGIAKVRDWDDYVMRLSHFLNTPHAA